MSTGTRLPIGELHAVLNEVLAVDPVYLTTAEKRSASLGLARAEARLQAARLRLLAASADVAAETGDRSAATWLANETREAHGTGRRVATRPWPPRWRRAGPTWPTRSAAVRSTWRRRG